MTFASVALITRVTNAIAPVNAGVTVETKRRRVFFTKEAPTAVISPRMFDDGTCAVTVVRAIGDELLIVPWMMNVEKFGADAPNVISNSITPV